MAYSISLQIPKKIRSEFLIPTPKQIKQWIKHTLEAQVKNAEIVVRVVDVEEGKTLNHLYRDKDYPTNVLSFPYELTDLEVVGDMVLCAPVILQEIQTQKQEELSHWAHLIIHGTLHLLGYDHIKDKDAKVMQSLEIKLLKELGFKNPY